jgi:hypothetical protein
MLASTMGSIFQPIATQEMHNNMETMEVSKTEKLNSPGGDESTTGEVNQAESAELAELYSTDTIDLLSDGTSAEETVDSSLQGSSTGESVPEVTRMISEVLAAQKEDLDFIRAPSRQPRPPTQTWSAQVQKWKESHHHDNQPKEAPGASFEYDEGHHVEDEEFLEPSFDESAASESQSAADMFMSNKDNASNAEDSSCCTSQASRANYSAPNGASFFNRKLNSPKVLPGKRVYQREDGSITSANSQAQSIYSEQSSAASSAQVFRASDQYHNRHGLLDDYSGDYSEASSDNYSESSSDNDDEFEDYEEIKAMDSDTFRHLMREAEAMDSKLVQESASEESASNVDEAIAILKLHAERLGVDERDLLEAIERGIVMDDPSDL